MLKWLCVLMACAVAHAGNWSFEVSTGTSAKVPNTLTVAQAGFDDMVIEHVVWETRPWLPIQGVTDLAESYYAFRLSYRPPASVLGYELEFLHDKAYYVTGLDPDHVVQHFELSDGHNVFFGNVTYTVDVGADSELVFRAGAGPAITNPATIVRGEELGTRSEVDPGSRYYFTGVGAQLGVQGRYFLTDWLALSTETRYVFSWVRVPINGGDATATFNSVHVDFGLTFRP